MDNVISCQNVFKTYDKIINVLKEVSLSIDEGEFCAIIGQSGSGKSTLLNILGTLDIPNEGTVLIDGKDTSVLSSNELARLRNETIGFIFQFHHLLPEFTVLDNVMMPYYILKNKKSKDMEAKALELLADVGLSGYEKRMANDLSGGQKQRVAIARALMNNPKIILADEPTGNLDSKTTEEIYELFYTINQKYQTTMIIVTHDQRVAQRCNRIIEVMDGEIISDFINR